MFAYDWHHGGFAFNLNADLPYELSKGLNAEFPTFYPDGDYYFFISVDWNYGLFGHPWRKEILVMGKELIEQFKISVNELNIITKVK